MSILENLPTNTAPRSSGRTSNGSTEQRPNAKLWLNVGYEVDGKFVNLPIGLPIDTMEMLPVRGQNEDWVKLQTARNQLLDALQKAGDQMEPGQAETINLQVQIRRVNEEQVVDPKDNEYSVDLSSIFAKKS